MQESYCKERKYETRERIRWRTDESDHRMINESSRTGADACARDVLFEFVLTGPRWKYIADRSQKRDGRRIIIYNKIAATARVQSAKFVAMRRCRISLEVSGFCGTFVISMRLTAMWYLIIRLILAECKTH